MEKKEEIKKELSAYSYPAERIEIVHASEVIETGEPRVNAIRGKKDSSIVKGLNLVKAESATRLYPQVLPARFWSADRFWSAGQKA